MITESPCPACHTADCPKQAIIEEKRRNPPRGMGGGLWMHSGAFHEATDECRARMRAKETT